MNDIAETQPIGRLRANCPKCHRLVTTGPESSKYVFITHGAARAAGGMTVDRARAMAKDLLICPGSMILKEVRS